MVASLVAFNSRIGTPFTAILVFLSGLLVVALHNHIPLAGYRPESQVSLPYTQVIDDQSYRAMAEGRTSQVAAPFTKRALYPWLAGMISRHAHLSLPTACMGLNCAAWGLLAYCTAALLQNTIGIPLMAAVFLLTPVPLESLLLGYMPELFHTALLALFFLLYLRGSQCSALVVLFLAFITRESTLALCAVCVWIGWIRGEKTMTYGSLAVLAAGMAAGAWFVRLGKPNIYHLPDAVYLALKVPYNFLRNVLGIMLWTNSDPTRGVPTVTWNLPVFLQLGTVREIGVLFIWGPPLETLVSLLTVFGFAPLVFVYLWRKRCFRRSLPGAIHMAFLYGLIYCVLGTSLGASIFRLIGEGWPLVWIAIPYVLKQMGIKFTYTEGTILAVCYILLAWAPFLGSFWNRDRQYVWLPAIPVLYVLVYPTIARIQAKIPAIVE